LVVTVGATGNLSASSSTNLGAGARVDVDQSRTGVFAPTTLTPVQRGEIARAEDAARAAAAPEVCTVEVRFKPVVGPTNHAFIVTTDGDSQNYFRGGPQANNTGINSSSGSGGGTAPYDSRFGIYGPIVTESGAYRPNTVDWTTNPTGFQVVDRIAGNCNAVEARLDRAISEIQAAEINYMPLSQNSNSTVREALERAGYPNVQPVVWVPAWNTQLPMPR
jgi:hypothetical protein